MLLIRLATTFMMVITWIARAADNRIFCSDYRKRENYTFYPSRHCQRSNGSQISAASVASLDKCADFARSVKALAFNYGHFNTSEGRRPPKNLFEEIAERQRRKESNFTIFNEKPSTDIEILNCEALVCPESVKFSNIVNDTRFDYYSLYVNPPPPDNITCIPTIGVFLYTDQHQNFSDSLKTCNNLGGSLAFIVSERRTNALSNLVGEMLINSRNSNLVEGQPTISPSLPILKFHHAWIGLNESNYGQFFTTTEYEPLECKHGCVGITDEQSWKLFDCRKRMPSICEIYSSGPNKKISFKGKCSVKRTNNKWALNKTKNKPNGTS